MLARWNGHVNLAKRSNGKRSHFAAAIRKYGKDAFSHEVLEVCYDLEVANLAEECWIEFYETRNPAKGFNLMRGGAHTPNPNRKNPWDDPEFRFRNMPRIMEFMRSPAWIKSCSKNGSSTKGRICTGATREKLRMAASMQSKITRSKISASLQKKHCKNGHSLHDAYIRKNGHKRCKICTLRWAAERKSRMTKV